MTEDDIDYQYGEDESVNDNEAVGDAPDNQADVVGLPVKGSITFELDKQSHSRIERAVAERVAHTISERVGERVDELVEEAVNKSLQGAVDKAVREFLDRPRVKTTKYGEPRQTEPTTLAEQLDGIVAEYLNQRVDYQGRRETSYSSGQPRREWLFGKALEGFDEEVKKELGAIRKAGLAAVQEQVSAIIAKSMTPNLATAQMAAIGVNPG